MVKFWIYEELVDRGSGLYAFGWNDAINAYDLLGLDTHDSSEAQAKKHEDPRKTGAESDRAAADKKRKNSPEHKMKEPKMKVRVTGLLALLFALDGLNQSIGDEPGAALDPSNWIPKKTDEIMGFKRVPAFPPL